jgi:tetratricopeptide (TPR) repeat protein
VNLHAIRMNPQQQNNMRRELFIYLLLAAITLAAFWPVGQLGFINFDDQVYVEKNANVQGGITAKSVYWAFTSIQVDNWHPVTWLSHMLDCQLFRLNAHGHHWMNLGFHIANVLLLFLVLNRMMGLRTEASTPQVRLCSEASSPQAGLHRDDLQQPNDSPPQDANKTANAAMTATAPQGQTVWRCALVAALFAWHPMRVESVAWISERKDVLSGFFMMLTLWAWVRYVRRRKTSNIHQSSLRFASARHPTSNAQWSYWLAVLFFALGLMSKPMLVTLPLILLLLDFWPLGRRAEAEDQGARNENRETGDEPSAPCSDAPEGGQSGARDPGVQPFRIGVLVAALVRLAWEKWPFLLLSVASSIATFWAQYKGGAVMPLENIPWHVRVVHALLSYSAYLGKMVWPEHLAIFYPYTPMRHLWELVASALLPVLLSIFFLRRARVQPWLFTGWFWFLGMLVPVIGLVQVGLQSMADRYTYLPSIGLSIMLAWGMAGVAGDSKIRRAGLTLGAVGLLLACLLATRCQLSFWQDNVKLFSHAVEVTPVNNFEGYFLLGEAYLGSGKPEAAARSYRSALKIAPDFEDARFQLGSTLFLLKKFEDAGVEFAEVLRLNPRNAEAHRWLGNVLDAQDKPGDASRALACFEESLKLQPTAEAHMQMAGILTRQAKYPEAVGHYLAALRLKPDLPDVLNNLAWLQATCPNLRIRNGAEAVTHAEHACELTHYKKSIYLGTLAAAYAEAGRFDEAILTAQKACTLASAAGEPGLVQKNQELLVLYRAHQPYHETAAPSVPNTP